MLPLKRILCPIDFSADSRAALKVAGEMAAYFTAELTVVHVNVSPQPAVWPYEGLGVNPFEAGLSREETLALRKKDLMAEATTVLPEKVVPTLIVVEGSPGEMILEMANRKQSDMIVIAPHGHNRIRSAVFGSTAAKVVKNSPCPVITLHAGLNTEKRPQGAEAKEARA